MEFAVTCGYFYNLTPTFDNPHYKIFSESQKGSLY